jgi:hypothetical protein
MLIGQARINLTANVLSALLGLASVFVFTRLFSPHDYGAERLSILPCPSRDGLPQRSDRWHWPVMAQCALRRTHTG